MQTSDFSGPQVTIKIVKLKPWHARLFLAVGVLAVVFGIWLGFSTVKFLKTAVHAEGEVVGFDRQVSSSGSGSSYSSSTTYRPKIKFTDTLGREVEFVSAVGSSSPGYVVGDKVSVLYNPEHPNKSKEAGFMSLWLPPILVSVIGSVFLLTGFFSLRRLKNSPAV